MRKDYIKINTFTQVPSLFQIIAYLIFLIQVITFYVMVQARYQSKTVRIIIIVLYSIAIFIQVVSTLICSLVDPSDPFMIMYRNDRQSTKNINISDMLYCDLCQSYVNQTSRHCKMCGRCVIGFDHHCIWINNCVGKQNYRCFIVMIVFTLISMIIYITSVALLWSQQLWDNFLGQIIALWCISLIVIVFLILIFNLTLFHTYLYCRRITTYDYIMEIKQDKRIIEEKKIRQNPKIHQQQNKTEQQIRQASHQQFPHQLEHNQETIIKIKKTSQDHQISHNQQNIGVSQYTSEKLDVMRINNRKKPYMIFDKKSNYSESRDLEGSENSDSSRISQLFSRNKSLNLLINADAILPSKSQKNLKSSQNSEDGNLKEHKASTLQLKNPKTKKSKKNYKIETKL